MWNAEFHLLLNPRSAFPNPHSRAPEGLLHLAEHLEEEVPKRLRVGTVVAPDEPETPAGPFRAPERAEGGGARASAFLRAATVAVAIPAAFDVGHFGDERQID